MCHWFKKKWVGYLQSSYLAGFFYDLAWSCLYWSLIWLLVCCFHLILSAYFFVWGETFCFWMAVSSRCQLLSWEWVRWWHRNRWLHRYLCPFSFSTLYNRPVSFFLIVASSHSLVWGLRVWTWTLLPMWSWLSSLPVPRCFSLLSSLFCASSYEYG